ncbi:succinate dehydrogenase/fumarate reductase iron-sulfur subunit [Hydrogenimonas sp.]
MQTERETKKLIFKTFRFNAETDFLPYFKTYELEVGKDELVLDILNRIKWEMDGSFSYRRSCRHGICGSCSIKVNGKAVLSCKQNVWELVDTFKTDTLLLEPLSKKRVVKDMIIDKKDFWSKHKKLKPWLEAEIDEHPAEEIRVSPEEAEDLLEADYCIQCGNCYYSCPVVEVNEEYFGPAQFAKVYRFNADVRDTAKEDRLKTVRKMGPGIWDCVKCYECAEACPKDVDPIGKITKLHNQLFEEGLAEDNVATRHAVGFKHSIKKHGLLDEGELVRYSEGNIGVMKHLPEAIAMFKKGKIVMPWSMPKSKKLDEIKTLIKSSSKVKF